MTTNGRHPHSKRLLTKPLKCSLIGLLNKVDRLHDEGNATRITIAMIDCIQLLLAEASYLDSKEVRNGRIS
ncbi:hypothetical protein SAMN06269301_1371 [Geobacter sp. DSM 9736]|nr:hypothetical protein SAMN06269301_1371 [Geobacter sp. DSM 9736]